MDTEWDCVIVGGGAAGLSAALVLGRARRRTLLVDAGAQSNNAAHGIGGLLGHDGRPPSELYATGRAELAAYPSVEVRDGEIAQCFTGGFGRRPQRADAAAGRRRGGRRLAGRGRGEMQTLLNGDVGLPVPPWPNVNSTKENNYAHA